MIDFEIIPETIRVNCSNLGFGPFSILIIPEREDAGCNAPGEEYAYYLIHKNYSVVLHMFTDFADTPEEAAERGYRNAPDYIPNYIEKCFEHE